MLNKIFLNIKNGEIKNELYNLKKPDPGHFIPIHPNS